MDDNLAGGLFLVGLICFFGLVGFCVRTCSVMPPRPDPSVECVKIGGKWTAEVWTSAGHEIEGFCSK